MQKELDALKANPGISILGVNQIGQESENALACDGKDIPWLQETMTGLVWIPWQVVWRDVVILDGQNRRQATFNLTSHDLGIAANYDSLRTLLLEAAE
jgi:hypothetical protein